jgi:hypothetical protein
MIIYSPLKATDQYNCMSLPARKNRAVAWFGRPFFLPGGNGFALVITSRFYCGEKRANAAMRILVVEDEEATLEELGWTILTLWECEINRDSNEVAA